MRAEFDTQSMRSFRNYLIKSNAEHHKKILASKDSYSLSMFRDLLFHVQEHRFSIPKIKDSLDTLGLYFCGFQNDKITSLFKAQNPAPDDLYNLEIWNEFEYSQPDTFAGMYQFWCQKS